MAQGGAFREAPARPRGRPRHAGRARGGPGHRLRKEQGHRGIARQRLYRVHRRRRAPGCRMARGSRRRPRQGRRGLRRGGERGGVGGGEDLSMFNNLPDRGARIRYRPDMVIDHLVEDWKLRRKYFLSLHYTAGRKAGAWEKDEYEKVFCGVPPFMISQAIRQLGRAFGMLIRRRPGALRQAMNGTYALGMIEGRFKRWRERHERAG